MGKGRRYENGQKLNIKKVIAVILGIVVFIMFIIAIKTLLTKTSYETELSVTSYYPVYTNEKWGVINQEGKTIIEPIYSEMITIPDSKTDLFICVYDVDYKNNTYKTKVINSKLEEKFTNYDLVEALENIDSNNILSYEEGILKVKKDNKYGLINVSGSEILPLEYDSIEALQGVKNSIIIKKEAKVGLCDNKGNIIIEPKYKEIKKLGQDYQAGYIVVNEEGKYGVIDITKKVILDVKYEEIKQVASNNMYIVKENGKLKSIDKDGKTLIENKFDDVKDVKEQNVIYIKNEKYGIINEKGEIKAQYDDLQFAFDDYYIAKKSNKYGIVNISNETIIPFDYTNIFYQKEAGFIEASKDEEESEILNNKFETKLKGIISEVNTEKGYFRIRTSDGYKYYNFKFEEKKPSEVLTLNTMFLAKSEGKYGYVDSKGNVLVDYIYDDAKEQNSYGFAAVMKDGKWGALNSKGELVVDTKYDLTNNIFIDFIGKWHIAEDLNSYYYTDEI